MVDPKDQGVMARLAWQGLGFTALLLMAFWSGLAGYWTAQRDPPVRLDSLELLTPEVEPGGEIRVVHYTTRFEQCELVLERAVVDSDRVLHRLEDVYFHAGRALVGDSDAFIEVTPVPIAARAGPARLRETLVHRCNPIHRFWPITQRMPDIEFTVLEPDAEPGLDPR